MDTKPQESFKYPHLFFFADSGSAPAAKLGNSRHVRAASLVQFQQDQACRAARPDFITPMMNDYFQISLQRRQYETLGGGAQSVLEEMSASNGSLTDNNSLRIQQIYQISDAETQVTSHLIEDPFHSLIPSFRFRNDGLYQP